MTPSLPPVLPGDRQPDVPLLTSSLQTQSPGQNKQSPLSPLLLISPHQLAVSGDLAAVDPLPAGAEGGGVDDDHLGWRAGEEELGGVTSLRLVNVSCKARGEQ